jgi:hypothetical protein
MLLSVETKEALYAKCVAMVNESIDVLKKALDDAQEGANSDTKGSAGDKHETGRAMMHLERDKNAQQLNEKIKLLRVLDQMKPIKAHNKVQLGSLVKTNQGNYFIAIPLAKVEVEKEIIYCISPVSPIGKQLMNCEKNASFEFNGKNYLVEGLI